MPGVGAADRWVPAQAGFVAGPTQGTGRGRAVFALLPLTTFEL